MTYDVLGNALIDYLHGKSFEKLLLHTSYVEVEEMPVE